MTLPLKKIDTNCSKVTKDHALENCANRRKISIPKKSSALKNTHIKKITLKNIVSRCQNQHTLIRKSKLKTKEIKSAKAK